MTVTRQQLLKPAVLGYLFLSDAGLPRLTVALAEAICRSWSIDEETRDRLHLCAYPTRIQNLFISGECAKRFGDLTAIEPFYKCRGTWWMDLDDDLALQGVLMPISNPRYGWIDRMVAFRGPKDKQGFPVKVRKETRAAA